MKTALLSYADVGPFVAKCDDPNMAQDPIVCEVVKQLDQACREAGFFYVVLFLPNFVFIILFIAKLLLLIVGSLIFMSLCCTDFRRWEFSG